MQNKLNGITLLTHLGVIKVEGEDAAKFLHGQLTQDFSLLGMTEARLAAFCSAKGRMQASFIGFKKSPAEIMLICPLDVLAPAMKRLAMFVMRAKAKFSDVSAEMSVYGLAGDAINKIATPAGSAWTKTDIDASTLVHLYPADGVARALWLGPSAQAAPKGEPLSEDLWAWGEVRSGIALITAPIVEAFVPQMLNYESVGGVNFKKGCYPGQEVVARSQFRGTLKRRAYLAHSDAPMAVGDEVYQSANEGQPCGTVAQAAASPLGGYDAVVSMQVAAFEAGDLHLTSATGPELVASAPPYPLLADI
ncbi:folate-binding protein YgfZ [Rhodoferax sp. PAMC 29310]|uniref:CAF17-like 4Fe-4S cluster assembly/insertion protein YgfZ n=1 Tax=Rhodoferax sp. PAMC 29310 TaxID=2822760 RepID=UPI001B33886E|nr:folate-binding protein YgfZ [Rhodoferax sp. PAMC 29310]